MNSLSAIPAVDPWLSCSARLVNRIEEIIGVVTCEFVLEDASYASAYRCQPGQFNMLYVPGVGEAAISLSGLKDQILHHTIRDAGNVTQVITQLKPGMNLGLRGPYGSCWPLEESLGKDIVLVAGGIGLAPLRPVIDAILQQPGRYGKLIVLHGARSPSGLLYSRQYDDWRAQGAQVETIVDRASVDWHGRVGVITQLLDSVKLDRPHESLMMTCGPEIMMHFACKSALARGIPKQQLWVSLERHMNCAIGFCGHCQLGPAFVCKDGPVFRYDRISPFLQVEGL